MLLSLGQGGPFWAKEIISWVDGRPGAPGQSDLLLVSLKAVWPGACLGGVDPWCVFQTLETQEGWLKPKPTSRVGVWSEV